MRVFKACVLVIKRQKLTFFIYFAIFMALSLALGKSMEQNSGSGFSEVKANFTVINRDRETPLTGRMMDFLKEHGNYVEIEDDKEAIQDARFNNAVSYVLIIPEGFQDALAAEHPLLLQENMTESSIYGYQIKSYVNRYWNLVRTWERNKRDAGEKEIADSVYGILEKEGKVEMRQYNEKLAVPSSLQFQYRVSPYIILVLSTLCVSMVFLSFQRSDIRMRNLCSPLKPGNRLFQMVLATGLMGLLFWILLNLAIFYVCGKELQGVDIKTLGLILLNSFLMEVFAMTLAVLAAQFIKDTSAQGSLANILSLGLSFLGGVFVPVEIMGDGMRSLVRFLPVYWYENGLSQICGLTEFNEAGLRPVWESMGMLLGFIIAALCLALAVNKYRGGAEKSFGSIRTEIEQ